MKKSYFTILVACLFLVQGIAQQVLETQRSLVTKRTADWCTNCGTYGWTYFENAIEQNGGKAVYIAAHYSGGLSIGVADDLTVNFGGGYQPRFFFNALDQGVSSGNVATKLASLKTQIDNAFVAAPIANAGFDPIYKNGEIQVAAKVKFFQADQGDFYLGMYLLEDHVTAYQESIGDDAVHRKLLRFSFTEDSFGQPITNGNVTAGQEFNLNFALPIGDPTGYEYEVVGIIWKKEGSKYLPINVWSNTEITIQTVSDVLDPAPQNALQVYPSVAKHQTTISVESVENQPVAQLEVFDMTGRRVAVLLDGKLDAGNATFELNEETIGGKGLYFVQLKTPGFTKTAKVIFQ